MSNVTSKESVAADEDNILLLLDSETMRTAMINNYRYRTVFMKLIIATGVSSLLSQIQY